ncbi:MAG TPA: C25 family cysteine peptidase [bacterium]|nr:C25 family cysteine peptidase [bacterium]
MKKLLVTAFFISFFTLSGLPVEIVIPDIEFIEGDEGVIPAIEGYELDGTGEKVILPYKRVVFSGKIKSVEIVEKREITLTGPLKKGMALYRLNDMKKVEKVQFERAYLPTAAKFLFQKMPTYSGDIKEFSADIYPVIPVSDTKIIKIDRVRIDLEQSSPVPMGPTKGRDTLLILTSKKVVSESKELYNFISVKRADGFKVEVATEGDYNGGDLKGIERVHKIRDYLKDRYREFYFLLIIDDPLPGGKGVPMVTTRPDILEEKSYEQVPTDIFYAEISEEIDRNNNGIYGEREDKIEFSFEYIVGRIPVYNDRIDNVDKILTRTIKFIKEKPSEATYRQRFLFPTTIAYYPNQDGQMFLPKMDGGYVVKFLKENVLLDIFGSKTLVEAAGANPSEFVDEEPINYANVLKQWNEGYGAVYWMGHGMPTYSVRTVWRGDSNNNGYADSYELSGENFVDSDMTEKMTHDAPFVFQGSCLNGTITSNRNLAYMTLLNTAVGVVGSSQVSYGTIFSDYNQSSQDLFAYGTVFIEAIADNKPPAQILQQKKQSWSSGSVLLTIKMETNYFGDPSLNMNMQKCEIDEDCDDLIFCNGTEVCSKGYCEKNHDAIPCPASLDPCMPNICDEKTKSCAAQASPDGFYCGTIDDPCFEGMRCNEGKCVQSGPKDCSSFDSPCSKGVCNSSNGLCELVAENEGGVCEDGLFCTINEKCIKGVCAGEDIDLPEPGSCSKVECDNGSESFTQLIDHSLNWTLCETDDGAKGTCYYGVCKENEDQEKTGSSGCSVIFF